MQSVNGVQFLNITSSWFLSAAIAAAVPAPSPTTASHKNLTLAL